MHYRRGRDGRLIEVPDVARCSSCAQPFQSPHYTTSWQNCSCALPAHHGHRVYICLRDPCRGETFDPPHDGSAIQAPLEGHRVGPDWDNVQHGPTLDLGAN